MSNKIHAIGQARFHFWGDYCETIVLGFKSTEEASSAIKTLNATSKFQNAAWKQGEKERKGVYAFLSGDDVERAHAQLESFGADRKKISSIKRSIDHGEVFDVWIEAHDDSPPQAVQQELQLA